MGVAASGAGAGLASMAPGVSSALVTTVVALLVAIPAMFGYNFLVHRIKSTVVELDNFSAELYGMLDRKYVDHGQRHSRPSPNLGRIHFTNGRADSETRSTPVKRTRKSRSLDSNQPTLLDLSEETESDLASSGLAFGELVGTGTETQPVESS